MSTQEEKLKAIADAIREKEGTTAPIPASDFPERIRGISTVPEGMRTITVTSSDAEGGTVTGGGLVSEGVTVTVKAAAVEGYDFSGWQENGETVSEDTEYTFIVSGDRELVAVFEEAVKYIAGVDWFETKMPFSAPWKSVAYGSEKFVVICGGDLDSSSIAAYSEDGATWKSATLSNSLYWQDIAHGNGKFVAVAYNSNIAAYSEDGISWQTTTLPTIGNWTDITFGNEKFVAVAENRMNAAYSSAKGPET